VELLDRLRGPRSRTAFLLSLIRDAAANEYFEDDGNDVVVGPEKLAALNSLTMDEGLAND
jgi:hypothetical protein